VNGYRELLEKEVVELWRTYRIGLFCALFIVLGIASVVLIRYLPDLDRLFTPPDAELGLTETGVADAVDFLVRTLVEFGGLAAILLAAGSVAGERERGTAALVLARPVGRGAYLLSKFMAIAMTVALATVLGVLGAWLYTGLLFQLLPPLAMVQFGMVVWLAVMVPASITFLGSTLMRSTLGAAAFGLGAVVVLALLSASPTPSPWMPTQLVAVARVAALEDFEPELVPAQTISAAGALVVASFALAWLRFRRQDV
jgi:ABC-2 type transport system permease protein